MSCQRLSLLRRLCPCQPETLIGQVCCYDEPYPTYPEGYDYVSDSGLPPAEKAKRVKQAIRKNRTEKMAEIIYRLRLKCNHHCFSLPCSRDRFISRWMNGRFM